MEQLRRARVRAHPHAYGTNRPLPEPDAVEMLFLETTAASTSGGTVRSYDVRLKDYHLEAQDPNSGSPLIQTLADNVGPNEIFYNTIR